MEKTIQFLQTTPEQLQEAIVNGIKDQLRAFKSSLSNQTSDELLTRYEVAEMLKISIGTVHNWVNQGILKRYGIGNKVYFKKSEVENALIELKA